MGIISKFFWKTTSILESIVGINTTANTRRSGCRRYSMTSAGIGDVMSSLLSGNNTSNGNTHTSVSSHTATSVFTQAPQTTIQQQPVLTLQTQTQTNPISVQQQSQTPVIVSPVQNLNNNHRIQTHRTMTNVQTSTVTEDDLNKLRIELRNKCAEAGIGFGQIAINMAALTGKTFVEFSKLDKSLQMTILTYLIKTIDRVNEANLSDVDKLDAVVTDVALMYHFVTHDDSGNAIDIENITPEELKNRREVFNEKLRIRKEEKLAEIENLPESEREAARQALKDELAGYRKRVFDELRPRIPFESAMELILIVSAKDLGDAAQELMESYPIEIREKIANTMQSFESFKEYINVAKGNGEDLGDEKALAAFEQYHRVFGTYKTKENLEAYEQSYMESRQAGEFSEAIYKAVSIGIGEAAYANVLMSSEEKESFIKNWVIDNDGFLSDADMARVEETASQYIEELIQKNPEIKDNFSYVKSGIKEIVEKTLIRTFDAKRNKLDNNVSRQANEQIIKFLNSPNGKVQLMNEELLSFARVYLKNLSKKFESSAIKKSNQEIAIALICGVINEDIALKNLDNSEHKFIKMCVQNKTLTALFNERIELYIKTEKDEEKLKEIAEIAPHDIVIKIVQNMRGDKVKFTQDLVTQHKVNHDTQVLMEEYTEKDAA